MASKASSIPRELALTLLSQPDEGAAIQPFPSLVFGPGWEGNFEPGTIYIGIHRRHRVLCESASPNARKYPLLISKHLPILSCPFPS